MAQARLTSRAVAGYGSTLRSSLSDAARTLSTRKKPSSMRPSTIRRRCALSLAQAQPSARGLGGAPGSAAGGSTQPQRTRHGRFRRELEVGPRLVEESGAADDAGEQGDEQRGDRPVHG